MPLRNSTPINPAAMRIDYSPMVRAQQAKSAGIMQLSGAIKEGMQKSQEKRAATKRKDAAIKFVKDFGKMNGVDVPDEAMKDMNIEDILKIKDSTEQAVEAAKVAKAKITQQKIVNEQQKTRIGMERDRLGLTEELQGLNVEEAKLRISDLKKDKSYRIEDPGEEYDYYLLVQGDGGGASMMPKDSKSPPKKVDYDKQSPAQRRDSDLEELERSGLSRANKYEARKIIEDRYFKEIEGDQGIGGYGGGPADAYMGGAQGGWGIK